MKLFEIYTRLLESKATEAQGLSMLRKSGIENPESIIADMVGGDRSVNQKNIPIMTFIYVMGYTDVRNIIDVMNDYTSLEVRQKVKPISIGKKSLIIGNQEFGDFLSFSEFIHGLKADENAVSKMKSKVDADFKAEKKPLWSGNGIDIYDGLGVGKCISYSQGSLTGKAYGFCIGQPGNTMYQSYRDTKQSTFYFIVDKNHFKTQDGGGVDLSDPLHMVVFDNTQHGVELTDANNRTGDIDVYGTDVKSYIEYLKSKGVPVDKMLSHQPKTDDENAEQELLGKYNPNLEWFMKLPIDMKSKYIGRGHPLSDAQFDYLIQK
jgi:hypothetical protein|tara:strand:- start:7693 stop:8652 length:960 start_codon:yes stop_codon:yes gene_type:complete